MRLSFPKLALIILILLGVALSGIGNVFHVYSLGAAQEPSLYEGQESILAAVGTPSPTSSPTPGIRVETTKIATLQVPALTQIANPVIYAFIEAPKGALPYPYVRLSGFHPGSFDPNITIDGTVNVTDFTCPGSPCNLPIELGESRIIFRASLSSGLTSDPVLALVWAEQKPDGYHVIIQSVSQYFGAFSDYCLGIWDIEDETYPAWAQFPKYPYELNTQTSLHSLAAQLIVHGLVDTQDCPAGGMSQDLTWPNGCGMERSRSKMIEWQNQYDEPIWSAGNEIGIPPRILKTLIQVESQFWPGNSRFYLDEYGLGQVNELGVDVLLRRDPALYQRACSLVLTHCTTPYAGLSPVEQAMVRGALLTSQNAECDTCQNGLDLTKARQSITFIAQVLRANCEQVKAIMDSHNEDADYETYWKMTMLSYHSGMSCVDNAVRTVHKADGKVDWEHITDALQCKGGQDYVDGFWVSLESFDYYRIASEPPGIVQFEPVFSPTRTPLPSPTPVISSAMVWVGVYMDANQDNIPQPEEGLDGIPVQLDFGDGRILSGVTTDGQVTFDLSGEIVGTAVIARLPGLYREYLLYLPQGGTVPVLFMFTEPNLPKTLP